jgi:oxalate decarboxylase/phosphoglucose isomerase-like protein (cupin superfamily)
MTKGNGYYKTGWDQLNDYPGERTRIYSGPLACQNLAFIIAPQVPGHTGTMHSHDLAEEVYVLLKGKGTIRVNDEEIDLEPLDAVRVEPKVMHTSMNKSDQENLWLVFATPIQEFLEFDAEAYGPPKES